MRITKQHIGRPVDFTDAHGETRNGVISDVRNGVISIVYYVRAFGDVTAYFAITEAKSRFIEIY